MDRRRYLGACACLAGSLAGCAARRDGGRGGGDRGSGTDTDAGDVADGPLLVTYCPLCGSAVTAARRVDGDVTRFGVSGLLYRQDLAMYDGATGSLWSQIEARAILGERTGERLSLVPST